MSASTILLDRRDDETGDRQMPMAVNYQALDALTIVVKGAPAIFQANINACLQRRTRPGRHRIP